MEPTVLSAWLRIPQVKAIRRPRLDELLDQAWHHRLTMVLAPAGSGKTTAVAELAMRSPYPIGWFASPGCDGSAASFVSYVSSSLSMADERLGPAGSIAEITAALDRLDEPIALVIDDFHTLSGTAAERCLAELVANAPDHCRIILAGRREPNFDVSRLRLAGQVLTVGADELRFRSWEAEQLFRELYDTWLRPDDIARLSQRVEGWAAGLQLFHLAARNMQPAEQRRLIDRLSGQARIVRDYLAANVLGPIDEELRDFLIDTCVLGVVTPRLGDELRDATGSAELLRELAHGHLFTVAIDHETYRYHEVLRSQLEVLLHERDGAKAAAERYRRAAPLLERDGFFHDALRCFAHGGDWDSVKRIASPAAIDNAPARSRWVAEIPASIVADDPWLLLAKARAEVTAGKLGDAAVTYQQAELRSVGGELAEQCRLQRNQLLAWVDPVGPAPGGWVRTARLGSRRHPIAAADQLEALGLPLPSVVAAVLRAVGGDTAGAITSLSSLLREQSMSDAVFSGGLVVLTLLQLLTGDADRNVALDEAEARAETAGVGWVARLARAGLALTARPTGVEEAERVATVCEADGDRWGAGFAACLGGIGAIRRGEDGLPLLRRAAGHFHALQATVAEEWTLAAIARTEARPHVAVTAVTRPRPSAMSAPLAGRSAAPTATIRSAAVVTADPRPKAHAALAINCLGPFEVAVNGRPLVLATLRPRARTLLRLLAINVGGSIHREVLVEALWPESDADTGVHNLQVAVSAVRKVLAEAGVAKELGIVRHGEAYRLALARLDDCDLTRFLDAAQRAKAASVRGDLEAAYSEARLALDDYRGELLAEDGPAEWVQQARARAATQHEAVSIIAAKVMIERGQHADAIELCEAVLLERPYADEIWRLLVQAQRERGDRAGAATAESRYDKMLADLAR